jgi:membrane-associated protease RseP (regulator of RpoE activity)
VSHEYPEPPLPLQPAPFAEPAFEVTEFDEPHPAAESPRERRRRVFQRRARLSVILFGLTAVSVFAAGCYLGMSLLAPLEAFVNSGGRIPLSALLPTPEMMREGAVYAGCVMVILLAHEMGHFLQAVRHGVPATFPFFIPFPISPFGTMGAVIVQDGGRANRRQLYDIAISGPLAGLLVALPVTWYGVSISHVADVSPVGFGVRYGDPLLLRWIVEAIHGPYGPNQDILLNAPLFAGWVGIFITALNLLPVGQLDGGHILYALVGRKSRFVAFAVVGAALGWMIYSRRADYALMLVLLLVFGVRHPPTANDHVPLGVWRVALGWLTLAFVVIGFTPTPIIA